MIRYTHLIFDLDFGVSKIKIIYASRTHTQLSQVMSELKRTVYSGLVDWINIESLLLLPSFLSISPLFSLLAQDSLQF